MLKLMKYEFIHSMRTFMVSFAVFLGVCFILPILGKTIGFSTTVFSVIPTLFVLGTGFLVIGICIALVVSIFSHYYRSMFQRPAYLTLTLPVSSLQIIISKLLMSVAWLVIGMFVLMFGIVLFIIVSGFLEGTMDLAHLWRGYVEMLSHIISLFIKDPLEFLKQILFIVSGLIYLVMSIYFTLTIVHTKWIRKHRLVFGLLCYLIINGLIDLIFNTVLMVNTEIFSTDSTLFYIIIDSLLIYATVYVLDNHIEIE